MRASDKRRERTVAQLRDRCAEGCLTFDTLSQRVDVAYRAKTVEELDDLVADLPPPPIGRLRRVLHALRQPRPPAETLEVELPLPRGASVLTLGRADSCDLRLADLTVSRVHAQLRRVGGEWRIRDLGSTNGTWLNGARIEEAPLHPGDSLALGGLHLGMR